jgi:DnaK suppressor protein
MDQSALQMYRKRLLHQREMIVNRVYRLEEELLETSAPAIDYGDRSLADEPEEVLLRLDEQSRREFEDVQAALERLDTGVFGQCERCAKLISRARLDALPTARRCAPCQERMELVK